MKLISAVFPVVPGDPEGNVTTMIEVMDQNPADVYLFPAFAVTGVTCGMLFAYKSFIEASDRALDRLCDYSAEKGITLVTSADQIGNMYIKNGELGDGKVLGQIVTAFEIHPPTATFFSKTVADREIELPVDVGIEHVAGLRTAW